MDEDEENMMRKKLLTACFILIMFAIIVCFAIIISIANLDTEDNLFKH